MLEKGNKVKINYEKLDKNLAKETIINIYEFDKNYNCIHEITNIFTKNKYKKNEKLRIELDNEYVFYENELIKEE